VTRGRPRSPRESRSRLLTVCGAALLVVVVVGATLPAASFTQSGADRGSAVSVASDDNAVLRLDTASEVTINGTSDLVNVTNGLGQPVTLTVSIRSDSTDEGDLVVDGTNYGDEVSLSLGEGATETIRVDVPDDSTLTDEVLYFHVAASDPGLEVTANNRSVPINA
jgi:hypothetical protein